MSVAGVTRKATQRFTREQSCERGEPSTICGGVPGARDLTTKYGELMSKHGDLDVLVVWGGTDSKQCEQPSNEEEGDRIIHVDDRGRSKGPLVSARIVCLHPSPVMQHGSAREPARCQAHLDRVPTLWSVV